LVNFDRFCGQIHNQDPGEPGARVEGHLDGPIVIERRLRNLDEQEDILGLGVRSLVEVRAGPKDGQVWLRL
jgi:hypothetical protein